MASKTLFVRDFFFVAFRAMAPVFGHEWFPRHNLVGRTYDMESAYRQLPVHPKDRDKALICVYDSNLGKERVFQMASVPFGAVASVYAFLRTAAAVNHLGCSLLKVPMTSYFDDFTVITQSSLGKGTMIAVETLFSVLGLNLSTSERKNLDFSRVFNVLGVAFDVQALPGEFFSIKNAQSRVDDLTGRIKEILDKGRISPKEAKSLRSRLNFASGQLYGRAAAAVLKDLGR